MDIRIDDPARPEIKRLLREHLENMALYSPPESIHALDAKGLLKPEITLWGAWEGGELLGCGVLKELDHRHGEIKSMRTAEKHRRRGVAAQLLTHLIAEARRRSYHRLSLETGSDAAFEPARQLYGRFGFHECGPFNGYVEDPYSVYMTRTLPRS
ncbi:MAG: GNAT family N-acetyltransferase [Gammaproteobacteria bacterium]